MKKFPKLILGAVLAAGLCFPAFGKTTMTTTTVDAASFFSTIATGYDSADDVQYNTSGKYMANWGAREEDCTFLTTYAQSFNSGSYSFETLSKKSGGTSQSNAQNSELYTALKSFMTSKHSYQTSYDATKEMYRYTDCVSNNSAKISSFYSGKELNGAWDSAATWNREHTWPKSKSLNGNSNGGSDEADVIMLRPTWVSENSSRGNTAYGQSSGYYDPNGNGANVRGDCARIVLYVYTRWGNTNYMWGSSGVMENLNVLLQWMEEDPVDTWEMGRNDVIENITGTRNVFVDYPEYAWLLFGRSIPNDMVTPSGYAKSGTITGGGNSGSTTPDDGGDDNDGGNSGTTTPDLSTPAGIIAAAQALSDGQSLAGTHTLTGKVTQIKQSDSSTNNVWLYMDVNGFSMQCYWLQDAADKVAVGDTITVTGTIKNYKGTIEYDKPTLVSVNGNGGTTNPDSGNTGGNETPNSQKEIIEAAKALASGASLAGTHTLTGTVTQIKQADTSTNNVQLYMDIEGFSMYCYWLQDAADKVAVGDVITVSGTIKNHNGTIEFDKPALVAVNPETTPDSGNGDNVTDPPCEMPDDDNNGDQLPEEPSLTDKVVGSLGMDCSGSISGGLTVLSVAIGTVALLLKKKED